MNRTLFIYAILGVFICSSCSFEKAKLTHLTTEELQSAKDSLKRIEIYIKKNPSSEEIQFVNATKPYNFWINNRDVVLKSDYKNIKQLAQKTSSQRIYHIQAMAAKEIILNYHGNMNIPIIFDDLENLAIQNKKSDTITQFWIDAIEGIFLFYLFEEQDRYALTEKYKKWAEEEGDNLFYEAYAQSLYCNLCNSFFSLCMEEYSPVPPQKKKKRFEKFRALFTELDRDDLNIYYVKGMNQYLETFSWEVDSNPEEAAIYCEEICRIAQSEKDNMAMQTIQFKAIENMLMVTTFTKKSPNSFTYYFNKLEEIADSYRDKPKYNELRTKILTTLSIYDSK